MLPVVWKTQGNGEIYKQTQDNIPKKHTSSLPVHIFFKYLFSSLTFCYVEEL